MNFLVGLSDGDITISFEILHSWIQKSTSKEWYINDVFFKIPIENGNIFMIRLDKEQLQNYFIHLREKKINNLLE